LDGAQLVEGIGLAVPVPEITEHRKRLPVAGDSRLKVPGQVLDDGEIVEGACLARPVAEFAVERQRLTNCSERGPQWWCTVSD
jgi:hypothetical protein